MPPCIRGKRAPFAIGSGGGRLERVTDERSTGDCTNEARGLFSKIPWAWSHHERRPGKYKLARRVNRQERGNRHRSRRA
jgi:hypothetical protein